ncbi:hypothetical protein Tco_0246360 [Tanacetum coccineum]
MNYIPVSLQNQAKPTGSKKVIHIDVQTEEDADLMVVTSTSLSDKIATKKTHSQACLFYTISKTSTYNSTYQYYPVNNELWQFTLQQSMGFWLILPNGAKVIAAFHPWVDKLPLTKDEEAFEGKSKGLLSLMLFMRIFKYLRANHLGINGILGYHPLIWEESLIVTMVVPILTGNHNGGCQFLGSMTYLLGPMQETDYGSQTSSMKLNIVAVAICSGTSVLGSYQLLDYGISTS